LHGKTGGLHPPVYARRVKTQRTGYGGGGGALSEEEKGLTEEVVEEEKLAEEEECLGEEEPLEKRGRVE